MALSKNKTALEPINIGAGRRTLQQTYFFTSSKTQSWRLDELVDAVFNRGESKFRLNLRPGRTGRAIELAAAVGLTLPGAAAAHRIFADHGWEIVIDFEASNIITPTKSDRTER